MMAAEAAFERIAGGRSERLNSRVIPKRSRNSWLYDELYRARNFKPWMSKGLYTGTLMVGIDQILFRGNAPWTLHHKHADHETLKKKTEVEPIAYPKPDGVLTFDMLSSVFISNTNHDGKPAGHLTLKDPSVPINVNLALYDAPEQRYCPAGRLRDRAQRRRDPTRACRSTRTIASIAKPATSRTRRRTSCGLPQRAAAGRITQICKAGHAGVPSDARLRTSTLPPLMITPTRLPRASSLPSSSAAAASAPVGSTTIFMRSHR